jgi:hypothetical protein
LPSGGYREPSNPSPAPSLPGALSTRTDGVGGDKYGAGKDLREIRQGAPMASASAAPTPGGGGGGIDLSQIVGLGEASTQPGTPVTDGAAAGAGVGPEALGLPRDDLQEEAKALAKWLPTMISVADSEDSTPAFKRYVRTLLANQ